AVPLGPAVKCTAEPTSAGSVSRWIATPSIATACGAAATTIAPAASSGTARRTPATIPRHVTGLGRRQLPPRGHGHHGPGPRGARAHRAARRRDRARRRLRAGRADRRAGGAGAGRSRLRRRRLAAHGGTRPRAAWRA